MSIPPSAILRTVNLAALLVGVAAVLALVLIFGITSAFGQEAAVTGGASLLPPEVQGLLPIPGAALGLGVGWLVWGRSQALEEATHRDEEHGLVQDVAVLKERTEALRAGQDRIEADVRAIRDVMITHRA